MNTGDTWRIVKNVPGTCIKNITNGGHCMRALLLEADLRNGSVRSLSPCKISKIGRNPYGQTLSSAHRIFPSPPSSIGKTGARGRRLRGFLASH